MSFRIKILAAFLLVGLAAVTLTAWQGYAATRDALEQAALNELTAIREAKKRQVEFYFSDLTRQIAVFARNPTVIEAMRRFGSTFRERQGQSESAKSPDRHGVLSQYYATEFLPRLNLHLDSDRTVAGYLPENESVRRLQRIYIAQNPHPTGSKDLLETPPDGGAYDQVHSEYHAVFRDIQQKLRFYDLFLIDHDTGHIVYTVFKEVDFGTSLLHGPHSSSNLARVFRSAASSAAGLVHLVDFEFYDPSYASPAAFIAAPVFDGGQRIGVLAAQVPVAEIERVMTGDGNWRGEGLGDSGETYIVGSDLLMRSSSRFILEDLEGFLAQEAELGARRLTIDRMRAFKTTILLQSVDTDASRDALAGKTDTRIVLDYRDIPVLSSFAPLDIPGVRWAVLSEMDVQEAFAEADALGWKVARSGVLFVVVFGAVALLLATAIARPLVRLDAAVQRIAEGVPDVDIPVETDDEIGRLARTVGDMVARLSVREHERFGEILEASPDGIAVVDGEGTLVLVNAQTETLFGYAREDLLGQPVEILVPHWFTDTHPSKRAAFAKPTIRQMRTETGMICRRKDGSEFPAEIDLGPVEAPDGSLIVATVRDITVRRQAEEKLQLARVQAEAANRSKSAFLNNVSHEFRTPLNAILGFAGILKNRVSADQQDSLTAIENSGRQLVTLVDGVLDLSRMESGDLKLDTRPTDLAQILDEIHSIHEPEAAEKGLRLNLVSGSDLPRVVLDGDRLIQALSQLVSNAVKFTTEGSVNLRADSLRSEAWGDRSREADHSTLDLQFSVEDTGIGIPEDQLDRIFGAFDHSEGQDHTAYGGTGLGLALTRRLVEIMDGEIRVESQVGSGSTFYVVIKHVELADDDGQPAHDRDESGAVADALVETPDDPDVDLDAATLARLPELVSLLREELQPTCAKLAETLVLTEIEAFAQRSQELGDEYAYPPLSQWAARVNEQVATFQLDALPKALAGFEPLVAEVEARIDGRDTG